LSFIEGGGEMGALIRAHDWRSSSLGPPSGWPQSLRTAVRLMLNTGHPMYIWWGPDLACLYNDAYRQSIGPELHPGSLGKPGREVWAEIWDIIGPQIEQVKSGGGATWHEDHLVPITRNGRREDVYWTYSYSPIDDDEAPNGIGGVLVICTETTQKILAERRQAAARQAQHRVFEQAPGFIIVMSGPDHIVTFVNDAHRELFGSADWLGKPIREAFPSIAGQGFYERLDKVLSTGEAFSARAAEVRFRRSTESPEEIRHLDFIYAPIVEENGITGIFCEGFDVSDRRRLEQERILLVRELEHRMKNMMAMVAAIVNQSFRGVDTLAAAQDVIGNRLAVLGAAHDILINSGWAAASMRETAESALAPHRMGDTRFRVSGPEVILSPKATLAMALVINELATNAVKYGAISVPQGHVDLTWVLDENAGKQWFRFDWREVDGPPASEPAHTGFGFRLIQRTLAETFPQESGIKFTSEGVHCFGVADYAALKSV
jgi:two-component sensor histidine kinase